MLCKGSYFLGDVVCRVMCKIDLYLLYTLYNRLMGLSIDIDDAYNFGVWKINKADSNLHNCS